ATIFVNVKPWEERGPNESVQAITQRLNVKLFGMKDAVAFAFNLPEIPGLGATSGVEANLQDRGGLPYPDYAKLVQAFTPAANQLPAAAGVNVNFRPNVPQIFVNVDRETAKARGVKLGDLYGTMQAMLSTLYVNDFNLYGRTYRVQIEAQAPFRH